MFYTGGTGGFNSFPVEVHTWPSNEWFRIALATGIGKGSSRASNEGQRDRIDVANVRVEGAGHLVNSL